jgi:hypothetical protein
VGEANLGSRFRPFVLAAAFGSRITRVPGLLVLASGELAPRRIDHSRVLTQGRAGATTARHSPIRAAEQLQRTSDGNAAGSPLNSVFCGPL